jgi:hypothetical protein
LNLLETIAIETGLNAADADRIIHSAPKRYKHYDIPKKSGGYRTIAQPSRELKVLQRLIVDQWLAKLPVHSAALAYVNSKNIRENAYSHTKSSVILKLDFENFFPSLRVADWKKFVLNHPVPWDGPGDAWRVLNILFWGQGTTKPQCLSIGAPSSPVISNLLMFELDGKITERAVAARLSYTRYADDITLSGQSIEEVVALEKDVRALLRSSKSPKLKINEGKRGIYTQAQRRLVTGLVITPDGSVSLGRDRKRKISTFVHLFSLGKLQPDELGYLKGMLGFAIANEPQFVGRLRLKYGDGTLDRVLQARLPKRHVSKL